MVKRERNSRAIIPVALGLVPATFPGFLLRALPPENSPLGGEGGVEIRGLASQRMVVRSTDPLNSKEEKSPPGRLACLNNPDGRRVLAFTVDERNDELMRC